MSYLEGSIKRTVKTREHSHVEGYLSENIFKYKKKRSSYVGQLTKTIQKIKDSLDSENIAKLKEYNLRLNEIMINMRHVTAKLSNLSVDNSEDILNFCTEQEIRVIEIRKHMPSAVFTENLETLDNFNSVCKSPNQQSVSQNKTSFLNCELDKKSVISNIDQPKSLNSEPHNEQLGDKESINYNSTSLVRAKSPSLKSHSSKSSSKRSSKQISPSTSKSSVASYLSADERRKTAEYVKLIADQAEIRAQRQLELLEKSFEVEKQKIEEQALLAREKANIAQFDDYFDEAVSCVSENSFQNTIFNRKNLTTNLEINSKAGTVVSSRRQAKTNNAHTSSSSSSASLKSTYSLDIKSTIPLNPLSHNKPTVTPVNHYQTKTYHPLLTGARNISPTFIKTNNPRINNHTTSHFQNLNTDPPEREEIYNYELVDKFIDDLIEGVETKLPDSAPNVNINFAIQQEYESRQLPPMELRHFRGNPSEWPEFISSFYNRVHSKVSFDDNIRMQRLLSVLEGEAKKSVEVIGSNGMFYATALKSLKRDFGNPVIVSHLKIKSLFDQPQIRPNDKSGLRNYHQQVKITNTWLLSMGYNNPILSYENLSKAVARLPHYLRTQFFKATRDCNLTDGTINLLSFEEWLQKRVKDLFNPLAEIISLQDSKNKHQNDQRFKHKTYTNHLSNDNKIETEADQKENKIGKNNKLSCWLCNDKHRLMECPKFKAKTVEERIDYATKEKLCKNCFSKAHSTKDCICKLKCRADNCGKKHHTLLHRDNQNTATINSNTSNKTTKCPNVTTFLQVLPVKVCNGTHTIEVNALLDSGSDTTLITSKLADQLKIKGEKKDLNISNAISKSVKVVSRLVNFSMASNHHPNPIEVRNAWVVDILNLPPQKVSQKEIKKNWPHLSKIPIETSDKDIAIIIGADLPQLHISHDVISGETDDPIAMLTKLGWVLLGGKRDKPTTKISSNHIRTDDLHNLVQNFWDIESYATLPKNDPTLLPKNDAHAMSILKATTTKNNSRYSVGLLWKNETPILPNNRPLAISRMLSLEKKFDKSPELKEKYVDTINQYIKDGHATKLPPQELKISSDPIYYIPHQAVTNINKPGKIRIVFDAGAKYKNTSLNENLYKGPDFLNNLVGILIRFRKGKYCVMADIEKMFHQVLVREQDRDVLRFLWRSSKSDPFQDLRMNVHLFGKVDSPCCCIWALNKTAEDSTLNIVPQTKQAIAESFYMDDYLDSFDTQQEAIDISKQVKDTLKEGGFRLTKWISNSSQVLQSLAPSEVSSTSISLDLDEINIERALGILWNPKQDTLQIKVTNRDIPMTKRGILSYTSSIFDPLGILSPIILEPKLIIQSLWKEKLDWDDEIPQGLKTRFKIWKENLEKWDAIEIPRWYGSVDISKAELHIFTDASSNAYGAIAYLRYQCQSKFKCSFVMSKSRLAPLNEKQLTIPRLELQAAVLACRMRATILEEIKCQIKSVFLWSDSKIVINYIRNEKTNFGVFIAHRINEIRNNSDINEWNYVPTKSNVADDLTKFKGFDSLKSTSRWCVGPQFLHRELELHEAANTNTLSKSNDNESIERVPDVEDISCTMPTENISSKLSINWTRYSSFSQLTRHLAWILKLKSNWVKWKRGSSERENFNYLTSNEVNNSTLLLFEIAQKESYPSEYTALSSGKQVNKSSKIINLNPIISEGLLKVGGRIHKADVPDNAKHQIIISKKHTLSQLVIKSIHEKNLHIGREHTLSLLRQQYWIPACRGLIRKVLSECLKCKRDRVLPKPTFMGDLPAERLAINNKPFSNTGVDYFGPYYVKKSKQTRSNKGNSKCYGVLFTCLTTRAVHIELADDLSTDAFLLALRRFISRRGNVEVIRSDNGTNFVGANNEMKKCLQQLDQTKINHLMSNKNIKWIFNPPASPWMGGVWESLVKSVKKILKVIIKDRIFTSDSLYTFLCEVEAILNGRPLTAISDDITDLEPLTPNHLLLGESSKNYSPGIFNDSEIILRRKWRAVQAASNIFWSRWVREYMPILSIRKKWTTMSRNFEIGDLVLIQTNETPRSNWPLGRILEVYPGANNVVRTVKLKTRNGEMIRPVSRIALLEATYK